MHKHKTPNTHTHTHTHRRDSGRVPPLILFQMMLQFIPTIWRRQLSAHTRVLVPAAFKTFFFWKKTHIIASVDLLLQTYI